MKEQYSWQIHLLCTLPILLFVLALRLLIGSEREVAEVFMAFQVGRPALTRAVALLTDYGDYCLAAVYAFLFAWGVKKKDDGLVRFAASFAAAFGLTMLTVQVLKGTIGRARPYLEPEFLPHLWVEDYSSFPSGHTTYAVLSAIPVSVYFRKWTLALALGATAALIAFTRVYLGMHYLTDLLGGTVMGNLGTGLAWFLFVFSAPAADSKE